MAKRSCYRQKGLNDFVRSLFYPPKNIYHYFIEIFFEGKNNSLFFFFFVTKRTSYIGINHFYINT